MYPAVPPLKHFPPMLQTLYRPMVVLSVGLHSLLLLTPLPSRPEKQPEQPQPQTVKLAPLTPLKPVPSPSLQALKPTPKLAQPRATVRPQAPAPRAPVNLKPVTQPPPKAAPRAAAPSAAPATSPEPQATSDPTTEAATETEQQEFQDFLGQFQSNLGQVDAVEGVGLPYYLFEQPQLYFTPESLTASEESGEDPELSPAVENILWASRKRPEEAYEEIKQIFAGYTFSPKADLGGGPVYEVKKGNTVRYVNLVRATDKTATFVVIWKQLPSQ
jgi:outer membrane biosynthesis protein TonB